jgi:hypothetical protein
VLTLSATGTSSSGVSLVVLGLCLLVAAPILYWLLPRFEDRLNSVGSKGKPRPGRSLRVVGGPFLVAIFGIVALVSGLSKL